MRMNTRAFTLLIISIAFTSATLRAQQTSEVKFVADTLIVQAEGTYEADPDLATVAFDISAQEKELKQAYGKASQSMQTIVAIAERSGLAKDAIHTGVLRVTPMYEGYRNRKAKAYRVEGEVILKMQDFSKVGPIIDDSIQDGNTDFRSLTYSLANEETAKKKAVADAMQRAIGRANAALEQSKQKLGPTRYVNLEVRNLVGVAELHALQYLPEQEVSETKSGGGIFGARAKIPPPPPPPVRPERITITATVQCVFGIER